MTLMPNDSTLNDSTPNNARMTLPLTHQLHQAAEQFRQQVYQQPADRLKAKQVYLNTLAVQAVANYLAWFGVETDLEQSQSWQPVYQQLTDVADVLVCHQGQIQGRLECRPVLPQAQTGYVPPEVWSDRLGYVFVQFDAQLTEATLLGFVPTIHQTELPLENLRSLDELFDYLTPAAETVTETRAQANVTSRVTHLGQWLNQAIDSSWQTVEALFQQGLSQTNQWLDQFEYPVATAAPAVSFRGDAEQSIVVNRGKLLNLIDRSTDVPVILLVAIQALGDRSSGTEDFGTESSRTEVDIWVRLCPGAGQTHLPPDLELLILDAAGAAVMQAQSRTTEMIQLRFGGQSGEQFSIQIVLGDTSVCETFMI